MKLQIISLTKSHRILLSKFDFVRIKLASNLNDDFFRAILQRISVDFHDQVTSEPVGAPFLTNVQRVMLGFMIKLEKNNVIRILDSFLLLAENKLLTCDSVQKLTPITRLYSAVCRMQKNLFRLRRMCCDVFYFCGDLALPFLFIVLKSWIEVLPLAVNCDRKYKCKYLYHSFETT